MARKIALILGLFVAFLPYLGFPEDLDTWLYTIAGLIIAFLAWSGKRPTPASSIEEMEGELHDATHEDSAHNHVAQKVEATPLPKIESEVKESVLHQGENTTVAVAFAKQRTRNLKKRITQEGQESTP
jgi:hypothetical protein